MFHFSIVIVERYRGSRYRFDIEVARRDTRESQEVVTERKHVYREATDRFPNTFSLIFTVSCVSTISTFLHDVVFLFLCFTLSSSLSLSLFFCVFYFFVVIFYFFFFLIFILPYFIIFGRVLFSSLMCLYKNDEPW